MRIRINGRNLKLNPADTAVCRRQVARIIQAVQDASVKRKRTSYYFTFLIMMHVMSEEFLQDMDPDTLQKLMDQFALIAEAADAEQKTKQPRPAGGRP